MSRGYLFKRAGIWYAEVIDREGKAVITDNCASYEALLPQLRADVGAVNRVEAAGHRIQFTYAEIVAAHPNYPKEIP